MKSMRSHFASLLLAGVVVAAAVTSGCTARVRYYDPYRQDYHHWNHHETVYYQQWEVSTHHNNAEFKMRTPAEQEEYWRWRHDHP